MPISESQLPANILTKCLKMSEGHRLHGINGNADGNNKEECQKPSYAQGGRLKFFKDGKFILELERALEGERVSWVSVHRKTYWPPQATTSTIPSYRQESSTSLSVSDDNSSMQSSPWQRDHSWKQTCPSRYISSEMNFYFWKPKRERAGTKSKKRRALHSSETENESNSEFIFMAQKKRGKLSLMSIIQILIDKHFQTSTLPRAESVVSPRKRFLREIEKDKILVDDSCQKRSRSKPQTFTGSCSSFSPIVKSVLSHNTEENSRSTARNCSYSITSLLTDDRNRRKSPNNSPSHCSPVPQPIYCSSTPEDGWYSESVDRLRSIELTQPDKCTIPPPYHPHHSFAGPYMFPFQPVSPYYSSGIYGRGYIPSMFHGAGMPLAIRQESPSCSWVIDADKELSRDNAIADKPLNLSKHPG